MGTEYIPNYLVGLAQIWRHCLWCRTKEKSNITCHDHNEAPKWVVIVCSKLLISRNVSLTCLALRQNWCHIYKKEKEKEWHLTICKSLDRPRRCYAKCNKSGRERHLPYGFTYMWNLKNRTDIQPNPKQTYRYREEADGCQRGGRLAEWVMRLRSTNWQLQNSPRDVQSPAQGIQSTIL